MYMPDALDAAINLMEADPAKLLHRNSFNVTAMSFDPEMIAAEIRKHIPGFVMDYNVEPMKQGIANSWPNSMDDSCARSEWNWKPSWNLESMTVDMLRAIREKKDQGLI
jgi:nucleoside-diphosphate-sugar epimerase